VRPSAVGSVFRRHRQQDGERAALAELALDRQPALVAIDDVLDDGEAQPGAAFAAGAARIGPVEALEEPVEVAGLDALALAPAGSALDEQTFDFAVAHLDTSKPPLQRINAAAVIGRSALSEQQLLQLASDLPNAGPLEMSRLLPAFDAHPTEEIGLKLVSGLKASKALAALPPDALRTRLSKFPASKVQRRRTPSYPSFWCHSFSQLNGPPIEEKVFLIPVKGPKALQIGP